MTQPISAEQRALVPLAVNGKPVARIERARMENLVIGYRLFGPNGERFDFPMPLKQARDTCKMYGWHAEPLNYRGKGTPKRLRIHSERTGLKPGQWNKPLIFQGLAVPWPPDPRDYSVEEYSIAVQKYLLELGRIRRDAKSAHSKINNRKRHAQMRLYAREKYRRMRATAKSGDYQI